MSRIAAGSRMTKHKSRLLIVANRLPAYRVSAGSGSTWRRSPGGLVSAMEPVLARRDGVWVGWDGTAGRAVRSQVLDGLTLAPVGIARAEVEGYYEGFSNGTLWPLYHDAIQLPEFHRSWWMHYRAVNERFADAAARRAKRGATVWVHDYQLQLVPEAIRRSRPDLRIGFFLHIPFPPEELFQWLPWRSAILRGLLGADLVAFQTEANAQNFSRAARRNGLASGTDTELDVAGRHVMVRSNPISIDADDFDRIAQMPSVRRRAAELRERLGRRKILLGVDRLDYTKGIPQRLRAFEELCKDGSVSVEKAVLVQIAVPSREEASGYREIRSEVEETVGRINGQFSDAGRVAVHYFRRSLAREELVAYYLAADVMLVTPLRDGMNLVAKEYVASRTDLDGVLVLSEFAGAARQLRRALLVNPRDIDSMKRTLLEAVTMPEKDRRMRMSILRMQVRRHDVFEWSREFLDTLEAPRRA
jgi:trehalose 6-phosphate synthase